MTIKSQCPYCQLIFKAPDTFSGKLTSCPKCNEEIEIPVKAGLKKKVVSKTTKKAVKKTTKKVTKKAAKKTVKSED